MRQAVAVEKSGVDAMTRLYGRNGGNVFLIFPTIAIGRIDSVWFIEAAWLYVAVGVIIFQEK